MTHGATMHDFQEGGHGPGHDYENGSPHLQHAKLREWIVAEVLGAIGGAATLGRRPRVLEVGAGHGSLTERLVDVGVDVVVTEMSTHSAEALRERFADVDAVTVVHDADGELAIDGQVDAVVYLSVLHHIPDYVDAVVRSSALVRPGGSLISFQDPLWYPRLRRVDRWTTKAVYYAWRLGQGEFRRGLATTVRQVRGVYDEDRPSDMVEYHVMRQGVDEVALAAALAPFFSDISVVPYWSTQSAWGQRLGSRLFRPNTFGLVAQGRVPASVAPPNA